MTIFILDRAYQHWHGREATIELERMREEMDKMEHKRSQMIAGTGASLSRPNSVLSSGGASSHNDRSYGTI